MPLTRREFLKGIGVAIGGFGMTSAGYEKLIPYVYQPENKIPGVSNWYATSCRECPAGCAMVVRSRESHVVKCEGNPLHPISHGTLCTRGQAALHGLYAIDRIKGPLHRTHDGHFASVKWDDALDAVAGKLKGKRIAFISDLQTGSFDAIIRAWLRSMGSTRYVIYEPIDYGPTKSIFGGVVPSFNIAGCDYLVSFACDFLENWVSPIEFAGQFATMRRLRDKTRNGFAYIGPRASMTAVNADARILIPPGAAQEVASALMSAAGAYGGTATSSLATTPALDSVARKYKLDVNDLKRVASAIGRAKALLALPGWDTDSARAASVVNAKAGTGLINTGRPHAVTNIMGPGAMRRLISDMDSGAIDALVFYGANPVFTLSNSQDFVKAMKRVPTVVSLSSYPDETTVHANWVLPSNTHLEQWGDYEPYPDVANLMQPTMGQLFDTRQPGDILIELAKRAGIDPVAAFKARSYYEFLRTRWGVPLPTGGGTDTSAPGWEALLQRGGSWPGAANIVAGATPINGYANGFNGETDPRRDATPDTEVAPPAASGATPPTWTAAAATPSAAPATPAKTSHKMRLWAYPHIYYYDGRNANRKWLQEIPEPVTKAVWDSWAEINPKTAAKLDVSDDDIIEIEYRGTKLRLGVLVWPGIADDTIATPIGEGHTTYGHYANGVGVNIWPILKTQNPAVKVRKTGDSKWVTRIKGSTDQHGREIVQTVELGETFHREKEIRMPLPSGYKWEDFYPGHNHRQHRFAMVVDMDKCIGCHACVIACYAENNLGIVEPDGIWSRREMSWMRIDRYMDWSKRSKPVLFQPMFCQHCDAAPCEPVCPVFAASHSDQGINMQIYNRCVGTRYCSNNCPYKVRRFNWWDYQWPEPLNYQLNPDVTVRSRGVMEKCTFCIQRVNEAQIVAKREKRPLRDGEIVPACVQTCPTGVFTFGDLMDPNAKVTQLIRNNPRAYQVLQELNTKTAVIYLKHVVEKV